MLNNVVLSASFCVCAFCYFGLVLYFGLVNAVRDFGGYLALLLTDMPVCFPSGWFWFLWVSACDLRCWLFVIVYVVFGCECFACFVGVWCLHGRFGFDWFAFCYLCLLVSVNSVAHWLVTYCMYGLVVSFFVLWFGY